MSPSFKFFWRISQTAAASLFAFLLWSLWLGLCLVLGLQIYIVSTRELAVPEFVLHRFERRVAEAGLRIAFSRNSLDPRGRVLIENVRVSLPEFAEPVLTARSAYVEFNPWSL